MRYHHTEHGSTLESAVIQLRVIGALLMREVLTRYGRHNIGFLWLFVEPMMFTLGVAALWTAMKATHGSNLPIIAFAITGYSTVLLWRNMPGRCAGAIGPNLSLMYHRNVKVLDVFLSRIILEIAGTTISFIVLTITFSTLGWMEYPEDLLKTVIGWLLLCWFSGALAVFIGCLSERSEIAEKIWHPTSYLLFPLSGAVFMVEWLPDAGKNVVLLLPMVHCVELIREGFFGRHVQAHYSISYVATFCLVLTFLALSQERAVSRVIVPE